MKQKGIKLISFSILIFCFSLYILNCIQIGKWLYDNNETQKTMEEVNELVVNKEVNDTEFSLVNPPDTDSDSYWSLINEPFLNQDLESFINKNSDTVAFLKLEDTNINYPVVQTLNNEYYLKRNFERKSSKAGWIFSDYRNTLDDLKANTIIYGHKRKDGSMFGTLDYLLKEDWYKDSSHNVIKLQTLKNNYLWQIFSVYVIYQESYYLKTSFLNKDEYSEFLKTLVDRSQIKFSTLVNSDDKIITLSTCLDNAGNRIVVHGKLIKKEILDS